MKALKYITYDIIIKSLRVILKVQINFLLTFAFLQVLNTIFSLVAI